MERLRINKIILCLKKETILNKTYNIHIYNVTKLYKNESSS